MRIRWPEPAQRRWWCTGLALVAVLYAGIVTALIAHADQQAQSRLLAVATDQQWSWRGHDTTRAEERFARRLGLIDGSGQALTELLDREAREALATEQAVARADDHLHRLVMVHGTIAAIAALLATVLSCMILLAWPGWTRITALIGIIAGVTVVACMMSMHLLPDAITAAWR